MNIFYPEYLQSKYLKSITSVESARAFIERQSVKREQLLSDCMKRRNCGDYNNLTIAISILLTLVTDILGVQSQVILLVWCVVLFIIICTNHSMSKEKNALDYILLALAKENN